MPTPPSKTKPRTRLTHHHLISLLFLMGAGMTFAVFCSLYLVVSLDIPDVSSLASYQPAATTLIFDDQGQAVDHVYKENRFLLGINDMPDLLPKAFVAAEDARFFQHGGVDAWSIVRAMLHNLRAGGRGQGGSTITQQVARSLLLSPEKTYTRKIKEAILAYRIDKVLSKNDILHMYLNQIYLGEGAYGVGAAAFTYFGKNVKDLTLAEIAILAGLPQAPSRYSPRKNFKLAKQRQVYVLNRMAEDGFITPTAARKAYDQELHWASAFQTTDDSLAFLQHVRNTVQEKYGSTLLTTGGLKIYTTMDSRLQRVALDSVRDGIRNWERRNHDPSEFPQAALVSMDARTGHVHALAGGTSFAASQFNRATQAKRQPGSAFKPIIYAAALLKGLTPNSVIMDEPIEFQSSATGKRWRPQNFGGKHYGPTTLRNGLIHSRNIVTIKLLQKAGVKNAIELAKNMGIRSRLTPNLSIALGTSEVTLLELTSVYTAFANSGRHVPPVFIKKIVDRNGKVLEENAPQPTLVLDSRVAYQITSILKEVITEGTGKNARGLTNAAAGKTGTTDQNIDAWFIGYTPSLVTGVWIGFDQYRPLGPTETGGQAAAPIWLTYMKEAETIRPGETEFPMPEGLTLVPINRETGALEHREPDKAVWEAFKKELLSKWNEPMDEEGLGLPAAEVPAQEEAPPGGE